MAIFAFTCKELLVFFFGPWPCLQPTRLLWCFHYGFPCRDGRNKPNKAASMKSTTRKQINRYNDCRKKNKPGKPSPLNSKLWREDWDLEETTWLLSNAWMRLLHSGHMRRQIYRKRVPFSWSVWGDKLKQHLIGSAGSCRGNVLCSKSMELGQIEEINWRQRTWSPFAFSVHEISQGKWLKTK